VSFCSSVDNIIAIYQTLEIVDVTGNEFEILMAFKIGQQIPIGTVSTFVHTQDIPTTIQAGLRDMIANEAQTSCDVHNSFSH
jgi:hypothetical protein